jgi:hypothetical protein
MSPGAIEPIQVDPFAGINRIYVFDTNAYREGFFFRSRRGIHRRVQRIRTAEASKGIRPLASPIVIWEMIAHVAEPTSRGYRNCVEGITALVAHTRVQDVPNSPIALTAFPEALICSAFFNMRPPIPATNAESLNQLAYYVYLNAPKLNNADAQRGFRAWEAKMVKHENDWKNDVRALIAAFDPSLVKPLIGGTTDKDVRRRIAKYFQSQGFQDGWAGSEIDKYAALLAITVSPTDHTRYAADFKASFGAPFRMLVAHLLAFMDPDINLEREVRPWPNFIWDYQLSFLIGNGQSINGLPVYLVTGDKGIAKAALAAGVRIESLRSMNTSMNLAYHLNPAGG